MISACTDSSYVISITVAGSGITWLRLRAYLSDGSFIEAFFNETTQKVAFARIREGARIFGADNTGGWHWHPVETPEEHSRTDKAVSFPAFLQKVESDLKLKGA